MKGENYFIISEYYFFTDSYRVDNGYIGKKRINLDEKISIDNLYRAKIGKVYSDQLGLKLDIVDEIFVIKKADGFYYDVLTKNKYDVFDENNNICEKDIVITTISKINSIKNKNVFTLDEILHCIFDNQDRLSHTFERLMFDYNNQTYEGRMEALLSSRALIDSIFDKYGYYPKKLVKKC